MKLFTRISNYFLGRNEEMEEKMDCPFFELQTKPTDEQSVIMDQSSDVDYLLGIIQQKNDLLEELSQDNLEQARTIRRLNDEIHRLSGQNSAYKEHLSQRPNMVIVKGA